MLLNTMKFNTKIKIIKYIFKTVWYKILNFFKKQEKNNRRDTLIGVYI